MQIMWINSREVNSSITISSWENTLLHSRDRHRTARMKWTARFQSRRETRCSNFHENLPRAIPAMDKCSGIPLWLCDCSNQRHFRDLREQTPSSLSERLSGVRRADHYSCPNTPGNPSRSRDVKVTGTTL